MSTIDVALLQMSSCGTDQEANLAKGEIFCRRAREMGANIALFPEMWNIGYSSWATCGGLRIAGAAPPIPRRGRRRAPAGESGPSVAMIPL